MILTPCHILKENRVFVKHTIDTVGAPACDAEKELPHMANHAGHSEGKKEISIKRESSVSR